MPLGCYVERWLGRSLTRSREPSTTCPVSSKKLGPRYTKRLQELAAQNRTVQRAVCRLALSKPQKRDRAPETLRTGLWTQSIAKLKEKVQSKKEAPLL